MRSERERSMWRMRGRNPRNTVRCLSTFTVSSVVSSARRSGATLNTFEWLHLCAGVPCFTCYIDTHLLPRPGGCSWFWAGARSMSEQLRGLITQPCFSTVFALSCFFVVLVTYQRGWFVFSKYGAVSTIWLNYKVVVLPKIGIQRKSDAQFLFLTDCSVCILVTDHANTVWSVAHSINISSVIWWTSGVSFSWSWFASSLRQTSEQKARRRTGFEPRTDWCHVDCHSERAKHGDLFGFTSSRGIWFSALSHTISYFSSLIWWQLCVTL